MDGDPPDGLVDTHVHVVSDERDRFPLRPTGVGRLWWERGGRDAGALARVMDECGVGRAVVVQAVGPYGYDNRYLLDAVAGAPDRLAAVPALDMDDAGTDAAGLAGEVRRLAGHPGVVGIRLFAVGPGTRWAAGAGVSSPRSAAGRRLRAVLGAAEDTGLVVVLTVFSHHLAALARVVADRPGLAVALDHCGFPELSAGRLAPDAPLLGLRDLANVALKVSSHVLDAAGAGGPPALLIPELAATFGSARLMWGSDHPQSGDDYGALLALARAAAAGLPPAGRRAFFGGNAGRIFLGADGTGPGRRP